MVVSVGPNVPAQPGDASSAPTAPPTPAPPVLDVNNIMGGIEQTAGVRMHNHRRKLRQRFDLVRKLGQGTYGKVQLGINKETGQEVAIKTIKKAKIETEADLVRIRREIQIMSSVRHPNIIHIYEVFENKEKMVLVMEYAAGGELYDYLSQRKVLSETEARRVFRQVASAVYYCHKHQICHRDLKLENILLDEQKCAKIADFGLSNVFDERRLLTTFCGSPLYASPEIVRGTPYHGPEVDCWSLGVLLYTLVYGAMPFDGSNFKRLVRQISSGEYYEPPDKPSSASPLIRHMLLVDPRKRANVEDICSHWWVNEGYGESCLEVAEELANQTPVRLDLLLSLLPPPESTETVVVDNKMDTSQATSAKETEACDSMNEYYAASKEKPKAPESQETTQASGADKKGVKKKKESSSHGKSDADQKGSSKRRRAEAAGDQVEPVRDAQTKTESQKTSPPSPPSPLPEPETVPIAVEAAQPLADASPVDDSGIQNSEKDEFADARSEPIDVQPDAPLVEAENKTAPEAKTADEVTNERQQQQQQQQQDDVFVDVEMDEGISTSSVAHKATSAFPVVDSAADASLDVVDVANAQVASEQKLVSADRVVATADSAITTGQAASSPDSVKMDALDAVPSAATAESAAETSPAQPETAAIGAATSPPIPAVECVAGDEKKRSPKQPAKESETGSRRPANSNSEHQQPVPQQQQQQQQRHSKILKQAELFNNLVLSQSRTDALPKSTMTLERPKKVTIYGFKVNDTKRAFEAPAQVNKPPAIVPVIKVSDAKKAFENTAKLEKEKNASGHHSLPRRTLIQTPPTIEPSPALPKPKPQKNAQPAEDQPKPLGVQPGEKVVVGGLGVKIGAIGKVTEIGMKVKTEESPPAAAQSKSPSEESAAKVKNPDKKKKESSEQKAERKVEELTHTASKDESGQLVQVQQPKEIDEKKLDQKPTEQLPPKEPVEQQPKTEPASQTPEKEAPVNAKRAPESPKVHEISVMLDTGDAEPKVASMVVASGDPNLARELPPLRPTSPPVQKQEVTNKSVPPSVQPSIASFSERVASPPPVPVARKSPSNLVKAISPPPSSRPLSPPTRALSPPLRTFSPINRTLSPPPIGRPLSPNFPPVQTSSRTEDDCVAGSENAFIRGIKSPTREFNTLPRRFSRAGTRDIPSPTEVLSEQSKPLQKSEINIAVSSSSLSATPRERIIPIKIEGREFTVQSPISSAASMPKVNSISVQLRSTPPPASRIASPPPRVARITSPPPFTRVLSPPPFARVGSPPIFRPSAIRSGSASRQDSVQSPPPPVDQRRADPIRKSPREFIIPITIEGGATSQATDTPSISSSKATRTERTKRYSSVLSDGESELDQSLGNGSSSTNSPLHHLQRFTSFKKSVDEPSDSRGRRGSGSSVDDDDDDDDDDTFQILTAESLFSTLLSRVRQLTRRNQRDNGTDPFVMFRNSSRFTSPAPSSASRSRRDDSDEAGTPSCASPVGQHNNNNVSNRNSIAGSDVLAETKGFWNNVYSRASSVASESDARRYSTVDTTRAFGDSASQGATSAPPWRREQSVDSESNCSIASASVTTRGANQESNGEEPINQRPFTSSLTRRVLNQHLKETTPECAAASSNNSDAMSENSSASGRSSLSRALSRLSSVLGPEVKSSANRKEQPVAYGRTVSSRELGTHQGGTERGRVGSPLSDEEQSGASTPASYRTFTRTRSREYFSPTSSRGASPTPTGWTSPDPAGAMNPIVPQLSTVLEKNEGESSPRPVRAAQAKLAVVVPTSVATSNPAPTAPTPASAPSVPSAPTSAPSDGADERKSRRVSRFLRPDFYDTPRDESTQKPRYVSRSIERYNPDAGLLALSNKATGSERVVPVLRATSGSSVSSGSSVPPSPLQPLLLARQNLQPIPHQQSVQQPASNMPFVLKPVELQPPSETNRTIKPVNQPPSPPTQVQLAQQPVNHQPQQQVQHNVQQPQPQIQLPSQEQNVQQPQKTGQQPQPQQSPQQQQQSAQQTQPQQQPQQNVPQTQQQQNAPAVQHQQQLVHSAPQQQPPSLPQSQAKTNGKGSPKLTVRRQFEHLINLAAAQFQRSQSPGKAAQANNPAPPSNLVSPSAEAISIELKQLEDEIRNTAAIKAQAAARLDALKFEYAAKTGAIAPPAAPEPSRTPSRTGATDLPIPAEFQPFQYKGSNGALRELSSMSRREPVTSPKSAESRASSYFDADEPVRYARIKRVDQQQDMSWASDAMDGAPGTPTDSYESSSVCSDLRADKDSGEDESVSERILRKSFYCRFNDTSKVKSRVQQIHRRSVTSKELPAAPETAEEETPPPAQGHMSRRSSVGRRSVSGRDESAEAVMVRKFLSNETSSFDRERRLSTTRRTNLSESSDTADPTMRSREASVARSVKSERVTSPTPSEAGSVTNGRESRSYLRAYSTRSFGSDLPPSGTEYSSASLGRRSYYSSSSSNGGDHINSLPRRTNRYSMHEQSSDTSLRPSTLGRSGYSPAARYSSIFEEGASSSARDSSHILSPTSARRHAAASEPMARRESTFYGTPSTNARAPSSSFYARSTSTGLDHHHNGASSTSSTSTYATMRPSYLRHRR